MTTPTLDVPRSCSVKRTRVALWLLGNGAFSYLCWYVATHPDDAAWARVLLFLTWLFGVIFFVAWLSGVGKKGDVPDALRDTPEWFVRLDILFDFAVIVFFVWLGWTWTAGAHVVHLIGLNGMRGDAKRAPGTPPRSGGGAA